MWKHLQAILRHRATPMTAEEASEAIRHEISEILALLDTPMDAQAVQRGWDEALKMRWKSWFQDHAATYSSGVNDPPTWGIIRAMDFDGIHDPTMNKSVSSISRLLKDYPA